VVAKQRLDFGFVGAMPFPPNLYRRPAPGQTASPHPTMELVVLQADNWCRLYLGQSIR